LLTVRGTLASNDPVGVIRAVRAWRISSRSRRTPARPAGTTTPGTTWTATPLTTSPPTWR